MKFTSAAAVLLATIATLSVSGRADLEERLVLRATKSGSGQHAMALELVEVLRGGQPTLGIDVEESTASVSNIQEALKRNGSYLFTAPANLVRQARKGEKPFEPDAGYESIRALFPLPAVAMHWVVRADSEVKEVADLTGHSFIPGNRGSFGERQTASLLQVSGLEGQVNLIDIDSAAAVPALRNRQVIGFAVAGPPPAPLVQELAQDTPIRLLGLSKEQQDAIMSADDSTMASTIAAGTYPGVKEPVQTVALPLGAYATLRMSNATAYALTKQFWTQKHVLEKDKPHWHAVVPQLLATLGARLHPGAMQYYREAGLPIPASLP